MIRNLPDQIVRAFRVALRRLIRTPGFTAFSMLTLGLGIGVTTATYSFVASAIHADPGVREPQTLVRMTQNTTGTLSYSRFSWPDVADLQKMPTAYQGIAAFATASSALSDATTSELVVAESVSGNMFQVLGVEPQLGRAILPSDDRPDAAGVVVLSDRTWRRQFNADPHVAGRSVRMAGRVFEIVGVAPAAFRGLAQWGTAASVWVPLSTAPGPNGAAPLDLQNREARELTVIARLKPDRSIGDATSEITTLKQRLDAIAPMPLRPPARRVLAVVGAFDNMRWIRAMSSGALFIASLPALVLLIACTNLGNLVLSRGVARRHEFAVRRALGASRARMVFEQLAEGVIIAAAGGLAGIMAAIAILGYVGAVAADVLGAVPEVQFDPRIDGFVFAAAAALALLSVIASSLGPSLTLTRTQDRRSLTSDGGLGVAPRWRSQSNLIAIQVMVSVALFLLTALGVTVIAFEAPTHARAGLNDVAFLGIPFGRQQGDEARVRATLDRVLARAKATPGVDAVEVATMADSRSRSAITALVTVPSRPFDATNAAGGLFPFLELTSATPGIFKMLGATMKYGRGFDGRDVPGAPLVAVINERLALTLFQQANAVGRDVLFQVNFDRTKTYTARIVGIVSNIPPDGNGKVESELFVPFSQHFEPTVALLARSSTVDVRSLVTILKTSLRQEDPDVAVSFGGRADMAIAAFGVVIMGMATSAAGVLATLALLLSMTGLYGVLSMVVSQRTREMGLRMALGADSNRIARLVLKDGFRPILEGLGVGLAGATVLRLMMQPMFTKTITAFDPIAAGFAVVPLLIAGAVACYLPARRATRVEPNVALRDS